MKCGNFIIDIHPGEKPNWHFVIRWAGNGSMVCRSVNYYGQKACEKAVMRFVDAMNVLPNAQELPGRRPEQGTP